MENVYMCLIYLLFMALASFTESFFIANAVLCNLGSERAQIRTLFEYFIIGLPWECQYCVVRASAKPYCVWQHKVFLRLLCCVVSAPQIVINFVGF